MFQMCAAPVRVQHKCSSRSLHPRRAPAQTTILRIGYVLIHGVYLIEAVKAEKMHFMLHFLPSYRVPACIQRKECHRGRAKAPCLRQHCCRRSASTYTKTPMSPDVQVCYIMGTSNGAAMLFAECAGQLYYNRGSSHVRLAAAVALTTH